MIRQYNIVDAKARPLSKICNLIHKKTEEMETEGAKDWTHREVGLILRDSIAQLSAQANSERDVLLS